MSLARSLRCAVGLQAGPALLLSCGLGLALAAPVAEAQVLHWSDPTGAESLTSSSAHVVWSTTDCAGAAFEVCRINRAPGNAPATPFNVLTVFNNSAGPADDSLASNLVESGGYLYWLSQGGQVLRKHYAIAGAAIELVSTMETAVLAGEIAVDETHVYWIENVGASGTIFRAPVEGGLRELVRSSPDGPARDLQVDGAGRVYYVANINVVLLCCADALHQITPNGSGGFDWELAARAYADGYVVDEGDVYLAHRLVPGGDLLVATAPADQIADAGAWSLLYDAGSTGPPSIQHLALSDDDLFWHADSAIGGGSILRMPRVGGAPVAITIGLSEARDLQLVRDPTESWLFWRDGGDIWRVSANAGPVTRDLDADDIALEVVQAIQDAAHTVPLTEGKRTFVRAYARLASSSDGATQLDLWPAVTLVGKRSGVTLPGSPLRPVVPLQSLFDTPVDRTATANQFLFQLPESWVSGTVELTAEVDPRDLIFETDETNNATTRTVTFDPVEGICIDIIPVDTTNGVERGGSLASRARTFDRARTLLPTDDLVWIFRGGSAKSKPWSGDPYNFDEEDDAHELMFNWFFDFNTSPTPSQCHGRRTIRTAAVTNAARFGISSGAARLIMYLQTLGGGLVPENVPYGGVAGLAHEVGHQLGQGHVGCPVSGPGAPSNPDGSYPHAVCAIDSSNVHIGLDPITRTLIVPFDDMGAPQYSDFMSYNDLYWVSDYVYNGHHAELAGGSPSPPVAGGGSLLVGGYQQAGGPAQLGHGYDLDAGMTAVAGTQLGANSLPSADLFVNIYDTNGVLQVDEPLRTSSVEGEEQGDVSSVSFAALVEYQPSYEKVEIVDALGTVLGSATYGANAPTVAFLSPAPGATLGDSVTVSWAGSDPDPGDVLEYRLYYSNDGGATWQDLLATRDAFADLDMVSMPTGANAYFRVLVSDGIHSSDDILGPFTIPNRAPEVAILTDAYEVPDDPTLWSFGQGDALRGHAYDSDDGPLAGASLAWTVAGPETRTGSGTRIPLGDLVPGDYLVDLTATDGLGAASFASLALTVEPRAVGELPDDPGILLVDGHCQDAAYAQDGERMVLRYEDGALAEIGAAELGGYAYFCFSGLPDGQGPEYVELRLDPDASADAQMQADDHFVRLYRDGAMEVGVGDGIGGEKLESIAIDVLGATTTPSGGGWQAELQVKRNLLGSVIGLGALHASSIDERVTWPEGLSETGPETWGPVSFVPEPGAASGLAAGIGALALLASRRRRRLKARA